MLPLWELGGGATALHIPDYRGSEEIRNYVFPIPWVVYRGEILRADRDGVRAVGGFQFGQDAAAITLNGAHAQG